MRFDFCIFLIALCSFCSAEYCKLNTGDCTCTSEDGWGVDVSKISGKMFYSTLDHTNHGFLVSLCKDSTVIPPDITVNQTGNSCATGTGYSVCKVSPTASASNVFNTEPVLVDQQWTVTRDGADNASSLSFGFKNESLRLVCITDEAASNLLLKDNQLYLYSPAACLTLRPVTTTTTTTTAPPPTPPKPVPEGLGTGAILSILILVTVFSYCTLGIFYNHFIRGTRGIELIPNIGFWTDLPGLCRDGILFIQNGCRSPQETLSPGGGGRDTYDSI